MHKKLIFLLLFLPLPLLPYQAINPITQDIPNEIEAVESSEDELYLLNSFINQSEKILTHAKEIQFLIKEYQKIQNKVAVDSENHDLVIKMVRSASVIFDKIEKNHLEQAFSTDFIRELSMFSKVARKSHNPKVS